MDNFDVIGFKAEGIPNSTSIIFPKQTFSRFHSCIPESETSLGGRERKDKLTLTAKVLL